MNERFIVDFEATGDGECADALLDFPSFGQQDEALGEIRAFDDFDGVLGKRLHSFDESLLVSAIDDDGFDPRV